jgi:hypothetical protein
MPLSLRALSEIRCVGSVLIAIMDQGSEVECSWILAEIITRNRHSLRGVFCHFAKFLTTNSNFDSFAKGLLDTHFFETYSLSFAV